LGGVIVNVVDLAHGVLTPHILLWVNRELYKTSNGIYGVVVVLFILPWKCIQGDKFHDPV